MSFWRAPRLWPGGTAYILGGGPSLAAVDVARLQGQHVIAINNAAIDLAPWAEVMWWTDRQWLEWNLGDIPKHAGSLKVARIAPDGKVPFAVHVVRHERHKPLSRDPSAVAGYCGGGGCINLAYHFGAARIVLFGFDMRPVGHWHDRHLKPTRDHMYAERYIPALRRMAPELTAEGVEVLNASPGSALDCWPIVEPSEVLP